LYHHATKDEQERHELHEKVAELGELAAHIALDLKSAAFPDVEQAKLRFASLNTWHRTLPLTMQLSQVKSMGSSAATEHAKRSLLQLHMLFLCLFIEPYRAILVDLGVSRLDNGSEVLEKGEKMRPIEQQCILAAQQSARLSTLLVLDDLMVSNCWVSVYVTRFNESFAWLIYCY
jgi:hypothetical protein